MTKKREAGISFLLAGFLLLSACAAPAAGTPEPTSVPMPEVTATPAPEPTPSPTTTPEAEPTPAPPTVAMERPDLTGEWHRTNCHSGHQATLTIAGQTEDSFLVEADCWYYTHSGVWEPTPARFIGENVALVEEYGYGLWEEEEEPPVKFVWEGDTLTVETEAWYQLGFGFNVDINGTYTREKPTYTNAGALERCLTLEQQMLLRELGEGLQWAILHGINDGCPSDPLPCLLSDGRQGTQLEIYFPTLSYYNWSLIFTEDGKVYGQNNPNFYTNDPSAAEMPEVVWPLRDDTHDCFTVPTGGRLGTVLVTVEMEKDGEDEYTSILSVWEASNLTEPIQTIEREGVTTRSHKLVDANFDGYIDFCYTWLFGVKNDNSGLYVWNEEQGQFMPEKEFLGDLVIDEEEKRIYNYSNGAGSSGTAEIFRWEDMQLVLAREIKLLYPETLEDGTIKQESVVEDPINGEWREVYREICYTPDEAAVLMNAFYDGTLPWYDLSYHGEP
ncbi:MAG: hypothetical protein HFF04_01985 [Oscillospiraceae bacterium]|nr:hypothetical protein [Oscillospiraceae bacterium]